VKEQEVQVENAKKALQAAIDELKLKRQQVDKLKSDFDKDLRTYQQTENSFKTRYRDQMARQYRIVNPEASEADVERMVESGETQSFHKRSSPAAAAAKPTPSMRRSVPAKLKSNASRQH